jgi:transcriptional regulator with XRE-family HTH domain
VVTTSAEIREFLTSRRARVSPGQAGFPAHGDRRVAGLRREEVAELAGVSVEWYTRLERGHTRGVSDAVLRAVARALRLDEVELNHFLALVHTADARPAGRPPRPDQPVRASLRRLLDSMAGSPAYVGNGRLDIVAANPLGAALFAPILDSPAQPANQARFLFLDATARDFFPDWELLAHDAAAVLRVEAGCDPSDVRLAELVRELSGVSAEFRVMWSAYDVRTRRTGVKRFHHPLAGPLTVTFDSMVLSDEPDVRVIAGTAEPGSSSAHALTLLASWAASD